MLLNIELKQLYTAITRAKVNLWMYESEPFDDHNLPILAEWRKGAKLNEEPLVEIIHVDDPQFEVEKSFSVRKSTPRQWKLQGDRLLKNERWKQASLCYRKAYRFDLEAKTEVMALEAEPYPLYHKLALAYLKVHEMTSLDPGPLSYACPDTEECGGKRRKRERAWTTTI